MCREGKQVFLTSGTAVIVRSTDHHKELCNLEEVEMLFTNGAYMLGAHS